MSKTTSLVQTLAVQSQVNLPGTAGRLFKQIRDLEALAPHFVKAGLVRNVERPKSLTAKLSGISTRHATEKFLGGFLFVCGALRIDLRFEQNALATEGQDSASVIDDIDFSEQSKRLQLIEIQQAYEVAERAMRTEAPPQLLLMEGPLLLNRSMAPMSRALQHEKEYQRTLQAIRAFWKENQPKLFPWNTRGTIVCGIATERLGALAALSQQDLRTEEGQKQLLKCDLPDAGFSPEITSKASAIASIGERRFVRGILGANSRTAAFKLNVQTPRMEPADLADGTGIVGFHYRGETNAEPLLAQLIGGDDSWTQQKLDELAGTLIAATVKRDKLAVPVPFQLAEQQLEALSPFLKQYCLAMRQELKSREIEDSWLSDLEI
jgi:hypothetical protein